MSSTVAAVRGVALFLLPSDRMGGAERVVRTTALEAARSGKFDRVEVFVQCWSRTGTLDDLLSSGAVELRYAFAPSVYRGIGALLHVLSSNRYALVFSSHTHLNALASAARRLGVLRADRLVARESTLVFDRSFRGIGRLLTSAYHLYGSQDLVVCQTDRMRESLDRHTGGRFRRLLATVPNPLDAERVKAGRMEPPPECVRAIPKERLKLVWCGRMSAVKSPGRAIDVIKVLRDLGREDIHLVMIGDGPERESIEKKVEVLGLTDCVTLTGHQVNPVSTMASCDCGLVTSDKEGFPNVVLEMLASGVRGVITTDCAGGLNEIDGVVVAKVADPVDLAALILREMATPKTAPRVESVSRSPSGFLEAIMRTGGAAEPIKKKAKRLRG